MAVGGIRHSLGPATMLGPFFLSLSEQIRKITIDSPGANSSAKPGESRDLVLPPSWDPQLPHAGDPAANPSVAVSSTGDLSPAGGGTQNP